MSDLCDRCQHERSDHATPGPKKPHSASALSSKQLAASIEWKPYPILNGPYTLYPTTNKAYCEQTLCSCIEFQKA